MTKHFTIRRCPRLNLYAKKHSPLFLITLHRISLFINCKYVQSNWKFFLRSCSYSCTKSKKYDNNKRLSRLVEYSLPFFFFSFTFRFKNGDNFWPCSCGIGASITGKIKRGEGKPMQRNIVEPTMSHQSRHGSPTSSSSPRSSYQHHRRESDRYSSSFPSSMHSSSRRKSRSPDRYYYEDRGGGGSHHHRHHRYDEQHQQDVRCPPSSHWGGTFTYLQRAKEPV